MKRIKKLYLTKENETAIMVECDRAWGRIENKLTYAELLSNIRAVCFLPARLLRGVSCRIIASEILAKAYKYKKSVAQVVLKNDGRGWFFECASVSWCYAGSSVGGAAFQFPYGSRAEIVAKIMYARDFYFDPQPACVDCQPFTGNISAKLASGDLYCSKCGRKL